MENVARSEKQKYQHLVIISNRNEYVTGIKPDTNQCNILVGASVSS